MSPRIGRVVTFYSYKGGVGRTMSLANVAIDLARYGYKVLAIDWDLEAPGLHTYFARWTDGIPRPGVMELVTDVVTEWRSLCQPVLVPPRSGSGPLRGVLDFICAGNLDGGYAQRLHDLDWRVLYDEKRLGPRLEDWRAEWTREYDFVLIDSRTGMSDAGGICTIQLPDVLVALFTASKQSIEGVARIARAAQAGQKRLPIDRASLQVIPVPTRVDMSEYAEWGGWQKTILKELGDFVKQWASPEDTGVAVDTILGHLAVPYLAYFSYGERLPAADETSRDKLQVGYALETLAALIARSFDAIPELARERDRYVRQARLGPGTEAEPLSIFISHDMADAGLAREIARELERRGRVAARSGDVRALERDQVEKDLRNAEALIYVVGSEQSAIQRGELAEFTRAAVEGSSGRPILSVVRRGASENALPGLLRQFPIVRVEGSTPAGPMNFIGDETATAKKVAGAVERLFSAGVVESDVPMPVLSEMTTALGKSTRLAFLRTNGPLPAFRIYSNGHSRIDEERMMLFTMRIVRMDQIPILNPILIVADEQPRDFGHLSTERAAEFRVVVKFNEFSQVGVWVLLMFRLNIGDKLIYHYRLDAKWDVGVAAERTRVELLNGDTVVESFDG